MSKRTPWWDPVPSGDYRPHGEKLTSTERFVFAVLFGLWGRGDRDRVRVSMSAVAKRAGLSVSTTREAVRSLERKRVIAATATDGGRARWNTYRLTVPETETHRDPASISNNSPAGGAFATKKPADVRRVPAQKPTGENTVFPGGAYKREEETQGAPLGAAPARKSFIGLDGARYHENADGSVVDDRGYVVRPAAAKVSA